MNIREMKIKAIMNYHETPIRMVKIQMVIAPNANKDVEKLDHSQFAGGNVKWDSHCR